jgi:competence protein ComEA
MEGRNVPIRSRTAAVALLALGLLAAAGSAAATAAPPTAAASAAAAGALPAARRAPQAAPQAPLDINSASRRQLKTLPGIGDAEAERIVAGRPYLSKADLASKHVIPTGIYLSIRHRIIANQRHMPTPRQ